MNRLHASAIIIGLALGACATPWSGMEPPEVHLVGIKPVESELLEQRFEIRLRVSNPNDQSLDLDGIEFTLELNDTRLARGMSSEVVRIPRLSDEVITVLATTTVFDLWRQVASARAGAPEYSLHGRLFLADSPRQLPFARSGTLDVEGLGR